MAQIIMAERVAAPDTPATGKVAIYVRDGAYYTKNAAGVETPLQGINGTNGTNGADGADGVAVIDTITYDNRGTLRGLESGTKIVDGLGLFQWESGSDEPDDDESCFATTNGRWLLEAVHWDLVDCWQLPNMEAQDADIEDLQGQPYIITGTATCSITSLASVTQTSFTATITGAAVGDNVIATPANELTVRISIFARVTADNTVTVYLNNPSAASATLVAGTWSIAVIKG